MKLKKIKIAREFLEKLWFTSDTHFGHANIIEYSKRPFKNVEEMDEALIRNWNERVKPGDLIFHLGDFAFMKPMQILDLLGKLKGIICYIDGNHDMNFNAACIAQLDGRYYGDRVELSVDDPDIDEEHRQLIILDHFPIESWHHAYHGAWHLHGHCHGHLPSRENQARLDVGSDVHSYAPISYLEIKAHMAKKTLVKREKPVFEMEPEWNSE